MAFNVALIGNILLAAAVIGLLYWNVRLERRWQQLFKDTGHGSVDELLALLLKRTEALYKSDRENRDTLAALHERLSRAVKSGEVIRFDAWGDTAGSQSFSVALVDERGDGLILSTLFARERTSVFAKPVKEWQAEHELSEEEQETLTRQKARLSHVHTA